MKTLYHFTCDHGHAGIQASGGLVIPPASRNPAAVARVESLMPPQMLGITWWTDLELPDRYVLGLTSDTLPCDRTTHRYRATGTVVAIPFLMWLRVQNHTVRRWCDILPGYPMHWWVASSPQAAVLDQLEVVA